MCHSAEMLNLIDKIHVLWKQGNWKKLENIPLVSSIMTYMQI